MTTDSTIDRLRELEKAATPGPWMTAGEEGNMVLAPEEAVAGWMVSDDAALIVESRNALPALLAVAEAASKADVRYPSILVVEYPSEYVTMPSVDWARIASALARLGEVA